MQTIKQDSVKEGDLIRITGNYADMRITRVGIVANVRSHMWGRTIETEQGVTLLEIQRDGNTDIRNLKIQLLNGAQPVPLFTLDENDR